MSLPLSRTLVWLMTGVTSMEEEVRLWLAPRTHTHLPLVQFIFPLCFFSLSRCWRGTSSSVRVRFGFGSGSVRSVFCLLFPSQHTPFCISCFLFSLCTLHFYFSTGVSGWFFSLDRPAALAVGLAIGRGDSWGWVGVIYSGSGRPPGGGGVDTREGETQWGFFFLVSGGACNMARVLLETFGFHRWTVGREGSIGKVQSCYRFPGGEKGIGRHGRVGRQSITA